MNDSLNFLRLRFYPSKLDKVCVSQFEDNAPPWRKDRLWQAANQTLAYLLHCRHNHLTVAEESAARIAALMTSIDGLLDRLGKETCARCLSPCCLTADVSYDFKDLLFLHLTGQKLPSGQPRRKNNEVCRYLESGGCGIPRRQRPWICTWYICAAQKTFFKEHPEIDDRSCQSAIVEIGKLRKQAENQFINIITS